MVSIQLEPVDGVRITILIDNRTDPPCWSGGREPSILFNTMCYA